MKSDDRRAARAAYKERKTVVGVYAVRCAPSGEIWVGQALDLEKIQNRIWFSLRSGASPHRGLQAAWAMHGADGFTFEALERLKEDEPPYLRQTLLKERLAHWRAKLGAAAI